MEIFEGIAFPLNMHNQSSWSVKIEQTRRMVLRNDDVLLVGFPRCGTHWLHGIIYMLVRGKVEHTSFTKESLMLEIVDAESLEQMPSPRVINTHLPFSMLPVSEVKSKQLKIIHVYRNPKDVCVSMFHFMKECKILEKMNIQSFPEFVEHFFFSDKQSFGPYLQFLHQCDKFQQQNPELFFFNISYEELKMCPDKIIGRLAMFLHIDVDEKFITEVVNSCSFDKMKRHNVENVNIAEIKHHMRKPNAVYRKGKSGDWRNSFTVDLNEKVDEYIENEMRELPFVFDF